MLDRTTAPLSEKLGEPRLPPPQIQELASEIPLLLIANHRTPIVYLELIFESGRWWESVPGVSFFAGKMLPEGAGKYSSGEIADYFESLGSHVEVVPGTDHVSLSLYALKKNFAASLEMLRELLVSPTFPEEEYHTLKAIRSHHIRHQLSQNDQLATLKFRELLFGEQHPYGRILTPEKSEAVTISQIGNYFDEMLLNNPKILLAGDVGERETAMAGDLAESIRACRFAAEEKEIRSLPGTYIEEKEDSTQASVRLGGFSISKRHPDIHKATVTHLFFGGYFGSRLMKNIREEKGLTYGIYSQITHLKNASYQLIAAEVEKEHAEAVIEEIRREMNKLSREPVSSSELDRVKNYAKGNFLITIDSVLSLASLYKSLFVFDLSKNHHQTFLKTIDSMQPHDIAEVAEAHLDITTQVIIR